VVINKADIVVKGVMALLVLLSLWSWAIIFDKSIKLGRARREAALQAALQAEAGALAAAWRDRGPTLAARLAPVLLRVLEAALGRPADYTPAP
jgi:biopolymer transport protein ExbB/TolQ